MEAKVAQEGMILTEAQLQALESAKKEKEAHGEIEPEHPGYLGAQNTYYVGHIKGVGRIYQQTFIDTYSKVALAKLYDRKNALVAADMLNDRIIPWLEQEGVKLLQVLTRSRNRILWKSRASRISVISGYRRHRSQQNKS